MDDKDLEQLLESCKDVEITPSEKEAQRRSFAYGNANIENSAVTKEVVDKAAAEIEEKRSRSGAA